MRAMTTPPDLDAQLESLQDDLRAQLAALNDLHHPVYPADPRRITEIERRIEELRAAITARRAELGRAAKPAPAKAG
jgi:septation ring formation regulator EzrA